MEVDACTSTGNAMHVGLPVQLLKCVVVVHQLLLHGYTPVDLLGSCAGHLPWQ